MDAFRDALAHPAEPLTSSEKSDYLSKLSGASLASDGFIPFRDNIDHASRHGVSYIAEPGGSTRDADIEAACREYGIALVYTNLRLFHH
jgi:phosphoribosylaminoimidazolecarboxamide formyltransferase/IMP cyclohydrolase